MRIWIVLHNDGTYQKVFSSKEDAETWAKRYMEEGWVIYEDIIYTLHPRDRH